MSQEGTVQNTYQYTAFGERLHSEETVPNRLRYNAQIEDELTGLYYLRARYFNPTTGRFTQEDVIYNDGLNLYAYCNSNPVMYCDPSGLAKGTCDPKVGGENGSGSGFKYEHNPSDNPKVLRDAIEDPNAVYGYRPREDGSVKAFAKYDWSDPEVVENIKRNRMQYHIENDANIRLANKMYSEGMTDAEVARALVERRNQNRLSSYIDEQGNIIDEELYNQALSHCVSYEQL